MSYDKTPKSRFALWLTIGITLAIAGCVWIFVAGTASENDPGAAPKSSIVNAETGAISYGTGEDEIATFVDFHCPSCLMFEQSYGPAFDEMVAQGDLTLQIHPISILDRMSLGADYSTRSASAMYCVAEGEPDISYDYFKALYANQPEEGTEGLTDTTLVNLARDLGAGDDTATCIKEGTFVKYVTARTKDTPTHEGKSISTPTVLVNEKLVTITGDFAADIVAALAPAE